MSAGTRTFAAVSAALMLIAPVSGPPQAQPTAPPAAGPGDQCVAAERVTRLGQWFDPNRVLTPDHPTQSQQTPTIDGAQAVAMRFFLRVENPGDRRWRLVIRDAQYRTLVVLTDADFGGPPSTGRWTGILREPSVIFDLEDASSAVRIRPAAGVALPSSSNENVFSVRNLTQPNWRLLHSEVDDIPVRRTGESVGMLQSGAIVAGEKRSWCCSGVMVAPDLLLTNWHCGGTRAVEEAHYWEDACANAVIDLGWDGGTARRQFSCARVVAKDKDLDFALLEVEPVIGEGAGTRAAPATVSLAPVTSGEQLFLVHHAKCELKRVSAPCHVEKPNFRGWTAPVTATSGPDLTHTCDTERGSSGGAVFDGAGRLVALHHTGFDRNQQCVATDDVNKAVRIAEIVAKLEPSVRSRLNIR